MAKAKPVLIGTDNPDYGGFLQSLLEQTGLPGRVVPPRLLTRSFLESAPPAVVVLETRGAVPPDLKGCSASRGFPVAVVSDNMETLAALSKSDGHSTWCFPKPLDLEGFVRRIGDFCEERGLHPHPEALWEGPYLIGVGEAMRTVRETVLRVSRTDLAVLIRGETGTGKGIVARAIHNNSTRRHGPFVEVNCSAIPSALLESELFGYRKGAFTGAYRDKKGKFDHAHGGSLFLDEISEMSPPMQAKLLQVLQEREYAPLGSVENVQADVRIFSATNALLEDMIAQGEFRQDLYFRLKVVQIILPPLRDRPEDLGPLREHFLNKYATLLGRTPPVLSPELCRLMSFYHWPGNVRELENCIMVTVALGGEEEVLNDLREKVGRNRPARDPTENVHPAELLEEIRRTSFKDVVGRMAEEVERRLIGKALEQAHWNKRKAAELLKVTPRTLYNKIRSLKIENGASSQP